MADEKVTSDPKQDVSGDDANNADITQTKEPEKVEITKAELDLLKQGKDKSDLEVEKLKQTIYSEDYLNFLQSKNAPQALQGQAVGTEENWEFMSQKELVDKLRREQDLKMQQLYVGMTQQQQEVSVASQIKGAETRYADFDALRPEMRKLAHKVGGNLTADECYRLLKSMKGEPLNLKTKPVAGPKSTEKPTGSSSGTVAKTQFSEKEALQEAARKVGLEAALAERQK